MESSETVGERALLWHSTTHASGAPTLTWFTSGQRRRWNEALCTDIVHKIEVAIDGRVETVHYVSISAARKIVVVVKLACCIETNGRSTGPVQVTTLVCKDSVCLGGVVCDDDSLVAIYLREDREWDHSNNPELIE